MYNGPWFREYENKLTFLTGKYRKEGKGRMLHACVTRCDGRNDERCEEGLREVVGYRDASRLIRKMYVVQV